MVNVAEGEKFAKGGGNEMSKEQLYQERVNRILTTTNHQEPDRVPVLTMFGTWAISYSNMTVKDLEDDPEKELEAFCKPHEAIYSDATYTNGLAFDAKSARIIGSDSHFISRDGSTVQHKEAVKMEDDEYPELINNPMEFIFNKVVPRKATKLAQSPEENLQVLRELLEHWKVKSDVQARLLNELKVRYGLPVITGSFAYPSMDIIFDYLRGFRGISIDMRRRPEELQAAIEATQIFSDAILGIPDHTEKVPEFPFYATMHHVPTFLSPKQFGKFFWPTYEKMLLKIHKLGGKIIMFLEGEWDNKYEFLNSLPKNFAIGICEGDDIFKLKKLVGDNMTLVGGMSLELLKYGTKEQCVEYAKKVVDECAPGGGYIFSSSRELLSPGDLKVENLIAVNDYVHNYAVYK